MIYCYTLSSQHLAKETDYVFKPEVYCDGAYNIVIPSDWAQQSITLVHNCRDHNDWVLLYFLVMKLGLTGCLVHLILPYVSYGRQLPEYLTTLLLPLNQPHVKSIKTFDLHQPINGIHNECLSPLIAKDIKSRSLGDLVLVAPDEGSVQRVKQVAESLNISVIALLKNRDAGQVFITPNDPFPQGKIAIIVDDMVDTGSTLKACANYLISAGAAAVHVYATHGVLSYGLGDWIQPFASISFLNTLPSIEGDARWISIHEVIK